MKKTLLIIGLGAAFLAVSLWVWLSAGRSAKAVRAKFRLGGALLTLTGMMALGGCGTTSCYEPAVECYDPAPQNEIYIDDYNYQTPLEVAEGDELVIEAYAITYPQLVVTIHDAASLVIQEQTFEVNENFQNNLRLVVDVAGYVGEADLVVSGVAESGEEVVLSIFELNITEKVLEYGEE